MKKTVYIPTKLFIPLKEQAMARNITFNSLILESLEKTHPQYFKSGEKCDSTKSETNE